MTQEQKAKAYDEALERARKQRDEYQKEFDKTDKDSKLASILRAAISAVEMAFPELVESEDERIRKEIVDFIRWAIDRGSITKEQREKSDTWIAYLEKQQESLHIPETSKENANSFTDENERIRRWLCDYFSSIDNAWIHKDITCIDILKWLEKQKECVSNNFDDVWDEEDCEEIIAEGQKLTPRFKELLKEVCHAWYDRGAKLEKQKEQKPADEQFPPLEGLDAIKAKYYDNGFKNGFDEGVASVKPSEWNEEDKQNLSVCLTYIKDTQLRDWLIEAFHIKYDKSAEWSEEDEKAIDDAYCWLCEYAGSLIQRNYGKSSMLYGIANKLKSLHSCPKSSDNWKPSEQEKGALRTAISILTEERNFPKAAEHLQAILDAFEGKESRKDWKPSEEQMKALKNSAYGTYQNGDGPILRELHEQLNKLCKKDEKI